MKRKLFASILVICMVWSVSVPSFADTTGAVEYKDVHSDPLVNYFYNLTDVNVTKAPSQMASMGNEIIKFSKPEIKTETFILDMPEVNIKSTMAVSYLENGTQYDITEGDLKNQIFIDNEGLIFFGEDKEPVIEIAYDENGNVLEEKQSQSLLQPRQRYYTTKTCPSGKVTDYTINKGIDYKSYNLNSYFRDVSVSAFIAMMAALTITNPIAALSVSFATIILMAYKELSPTGTFCHISERIWHHKNGGTITGLGWVEYSERSFYRSVTSDKIDTDYIWHVWAY